MSRPPHELSPAFSTQDFQENLYTHYRMFLADTPVFRTPDGVVYLTRHADCASLLGNDQFKRNAPGGGCPFGPRKPNPLPLEAMIEKWVIFMDPPRHGLVRKAFSAPFTAKNIARAEPFVRRRCQELLADLPRQGPTELLRGFAFPLPIMVIAELVGIPEVDLSQFYEWSAELAKSLDRADAAGLAHGSKVAVELTDYFTALVRQGRSLPEHTLIRMLVDDPGLALTPAELVAGLVFMLMSGHETTKNLIACGLLTLARRPGLLAELKATPELIPAAIEEMLRIDSPVQKMSRWTHGPAVFGDYEVKAGTLMTAMIGAANRDPAIFTSPDEFDLNRPKNRHLAFGVGQHFCLGSMLARLEGRAALEAFLPLVRDLAPGRHVWRTHSSLRSLDELELQVSWA
jgi:cytochrome P450